MTCGVDGCVHEAISEARLEGSFYATKLEDVPVSWNELRQIMVPVEAKKTFHVPLCGDCSAFFNKIVQDKNNYAPPAFFMMALQKKSEVQIGNKKQDS